MNADSETIHIRLAEDALGDHPSESDALALMLFFHTQHIWLRVPALRDRPGVTELAAITRSHAAEAVAAAWPDRSDERRTDYRYWLELSTARTPYEVIEEVPEDWMIRLRRVERRLAQNPAIERAEPED